MGIVSSFSLSPYIDLYLQTLISNIETTKGRGELVEDTEGNLFWSVAVDGEEAQLGKFNPPSGT